MWGKVNVWKKHKLYQRKRNSTSYPDGVLHLLQNFSIFLQKKNREIKTNLFSDSLKASKMAQNAHNDHNLTLLTKQRLSLKWFSTLCHSDLIKQASAICRQWGWLSYLNFLTNFHFWHFWYSVEKVANELQEGMSQRYIFIHIFKTRSVTSWHQFCKRQTLTVWIAKS